MIKVNHIHKSFGAQTVLRNVSFEVGDGESVAVIGRSGSGKTTLALTVVASAQRDGGTAAFIDAEARLLTCGTEEENQYGNSHPGLLGHVGEGAVAVVAV